jgi:hypothetical protein
MSYLLLRLRWHFPLKGMPSGIVVATMEISEYTHGELFKISFGKKHPIAVTAKDPSLVHIQ